MAIHEQDLAGFILRHGKTIRNVQWGVNLPHPSRHGFSSFARPDVKFQFSTGTSKDFLDPLRAKLH